MRNKSFSNQLTEARGFILDRIQGPLEEDIQEIVNSISEIIHDKNKEVWVLRQEKDRLERKNKKLESRMFTDSLTRITNRGKFDIELKKEVQKWEVFSLLFFDVDNFKNVNDTYWHLSGDLVLKKIARKIKKKIKSSDIFARYWWEEFIIILPWTNIEWWEIFSQRIRKIIKKLKIIDKQWNKIKVTVSIWVVEFSEYDDVNSLLKRADDALYVAKDSWKDRVICW